MAKKGKNVKRACCLAVVVVFAGVVSGFCAEDTKPSKEGPKAEAVREKGASPKGASKRSAPG